MSEHSPSDAREQGNEYRPPTWQDSLPENIDEREQAWSYDSMTLDQLADVISDAESQGDISTSNEAQHYLEQKIEEKVAGLSDELPEYEDRHGNLVVDEKTPRQRYREQLVNKYLDKAIGGVKETHDELATTFSPEKTVVSDNEQAQALVEVIEGSEREVKSEISRLDSKIDEAVENLRTEFKEELAVVRRATLAQGAPTSEIKTFTANGTEVVAETPSTEEAPESASPEAEPAQETGPSDVEKAQELAAAYDLDDPVQVAKYREALEKAGIPTSGKDGKALRRLAQGIETPEENNETEQPKTSEQMVDDAVRSRLEERKKDQAELAAKLEDATLSDDEKARIRADIRVNDMMIGLLEGELSSSEQSTAAESPEQEPAEERVVGKELELYTGETSSTAPSLDHLPVREDASEHTKERGWKRLINKLNPFLIKIGIDSKLSEAKAEAGDAMWGEYQQAVAGKSDRLDRFKDDIKQENPDISDFQLGREIRRRERAFNKSINNTGWNHLKNLGREVRRKINKEDYETEAEYDEAKRHKRNVIIGAVAIGAPVILGATFVGLKAAGAFEHGGEPSADVPQSDLDSMPARNEGIDPREQAMISRHEESIDVPEPLEAVGPGEYTADNIDINYAEYASPDKVSEWAMGTSMDMSSIDTAMGQMFDRAEGGPDHSAQMINWLSDEQMREFGLDGMTPQQIEEALHDDALRADVLNAVYDVIENGDGSAEIIDHASGTFYNWGARPIYDADGNLVDTELVQEVTYLEDVSLIRGQDADGNVFYFNSACKNFLTEVPHPDVPIIEGTGDEGTGFEGTGSEGTGEETGTEGTGVEGTGEEGTGTEGTGEETGDEKDYDGGVDTAPGIDPDENGYDPETDDTGDPTEVGNGTDSPSIGEDNAPVEQPGSEVNFNDESATENTNEQVATPEEGVNGDTGVNYTPENNEQQVQQEQAQEQQQQANDVATQTEEQMSHEGAVDQAVQEEQAGIDPVTGRPIQP